jgi:hypothetical protein
VQETYYHLTVSGIPVGRGVEPGPPHGPDLRVGGFSAELPEPQRLRKYRQVHGEDAEVLLLRVRDDGSEGGSVNMTIGYADAKPADGPLVWVSLSLDQARLVHSALGCVLQMREAQAKSRKPEAAESCSLPTG